MTPMYDGTSPVGGGLLPARVSNVRPQTFAGAVVGSDVTAAAKPLNESGALPPVRRFWSHHESLHQFTLTFGAVEAAVASPSTNAPRLGKANTITDALCEDGW